MTERSDASTLPQALVRKIAEFRQGFGQRHGYHDVRAGATWRGMQPVYQRLFSACVRSATTRDDQGCGFVSSRWDRRLIYDFATRGMCEMRFLFRVKLVSSWGRARRRHEADARRTFSTITPGGFSTEVWHTVWIRSEPWPRTMGVPRACPIPTPVSRVASSAPRTGPDEKVREPAGARVYNCAQPAGHHGKHGSMADGVNLNVVDKAADRVALAMRAECDGCLPLPSPPARFRPTVVPRGGRDRRSRVAAPFLPPRRERA
jgi:hypothetical protein